MAVPMSREKPAPKPGRLDAKPIAVAKAAGKTNKIADSLVKCEVNLEKGKWASPEPCAVFLIDSEAKFPEIIYRIETDDPGPYEWTWSISWEVKACPQNKKSARFKAKHAKTFFASGKGDSTTKEWNATLNGKVLGGLLTVSCKTPTLTFVRKTIINGQQTDKEHVLAELLQYEKDFPEDVKLARLIFEQESRFLHFYPDNQPLVSFDNGYGLGQATDPTPSFEEVWHWKKHVAYIVKAVIPSKRKEAKKYLSPHPFTTEELNMETLVYYNGANAHYLVWDEKEKKWIKNLDVLCDPTQSNKGWDLTDDKNANKTLEQLRDNKGAKPKYTGRCYAEHIKNHGGKL